jgi:hypothetical protein
MGKQTGKKTDKKMGKLMQTKSEFLPLEKKGCPGAAF